MVEFKKPVETVIDGKVGTFLSLIGENGTWKMNENNYNGEQRLFIDGYKEDGSTARFYCSPAVTKQIRNKQLTLAQAFQLPVLLRESKSGEEILVISTIGNVQSGSLKGMSAVAAPAATNKFLPNELVAF